MLIAFPLVFFAIWWAWMNFTWFASAYDVDDVPYRFAVLVQMTGVLIFAAGISRAMEHWNFDLMVLGYVVMRLAMVSLWIRAAISDPGGRRSALRYAVGIAVVQVGMDRGLVVPLSARATALHRPGGRRARRCRSSPRPRAARRGIRGHIAERLGLFTIIVLGEACSRRRSACTPPSSKRAPCTKFCGRRSGVCSRVFSMWWIYFDLPSERIVENVRRAVLRSA